LGSLLRIAKTYHKTRSVAKQDVEKSPSAFAQFRISSFEFRVEPETRDPKPETVVEYAERASHFGFDWPKIEPVWQKIEEELTELKSASSSGDKRQIEEEMGDLLFSLVNLSRFLGIETEDILGHTIDRFIRRFSYITVFLYRRQVT